MPDDSDSSDSDEIIDDRTGAFTHYICNTHKLEGSVFIPKDEKLVIYQKRAVETIFRENEREAAERAAQE